MAAWRQPDPALSQWRVSVTTARDGNLSFRYGPAEQVSGARQRLLAELGIRPDHALSLSLDVAYGVHWLKARPAGHPILKQQGFPSEGVWLPGSGVALFLLVGDCFPIAAYDPMSGTIGVFHAGRPELQAGLLQQWLALGQEHHLHFGSLRVFIGPGICKKHYVFHSLPSNVSEEFQPYIQLIGNEHQVDLQAYIRAVLDETGIRLEHIFVDARCTYESAELFSHRRSKAHRLPEQRLALLNGLG